MKCFWKNTDFSGEKKTKSRKIEMLDMHSHV